MIRRVCLHIGRQEQGGHVQKQHKTTGHRAHKEVVCSVFNSFEHTSTGGGGRRWGRRKKPEVEQMQFRYHFEKGGKEKRSRPRVLVVFEDKNQGGGIKERHMLCCCCVFGTTYQVGRDLVSVARRNKKRGLGRPPVLDMMCSKKKKCILLCMHRSLPYMLNPTPRISLVFYRVLHETMKTSFWSDVL
jgi:hypothetical protein